MSIDQMSIDQMSVYQITFGWMVFDWKSWNHIMPSVSVQSIWSESQHYYSTRGPKVKTFQAASDAGTQ
jgi:hypothetical protein